MKSILLTILIVLCSACGTFRDWKYNPESRADERNLYVVSHGWHTGIVIPSQLLEGKLEFLAEDFIDAKFYEVGWGDKGFYQAKEITSGLTMRAIFWPTESVMHVVAMPKEPQLYFPNSEIIEVVISSEGLEYLLHSVSRSFKRDTEGNVFKSKNGIYGQSSFYEGEGRYYMTNTCNSWVARVLASAGIPIRTKLTLTAGSVSRQTREAVEEYSCCP